MPRRFGRVWCGRRECQKDMGFLAGLIERGSCCDLRQGSDNLASTACTSLKDRRRGCIAAPRPRRAPRRPSGYLGHRAHAGARVPPRANRSRLTNRTPWRAAGGDGETSSAVRVIEAVDESSEGPATPEFGPK
jgi:hypothetical protein